MKLMGRSSGAVGVACAVTVLAVSTAQGATIFVDAANCPGPGDGSVGNPYCSIQTAIDNAVDDDEVVVAQSTFCPIPVCPGDITGDGDVGINDFLAVLAAWGACP